MATILTPYELSNTTQTGSKFWRKRVLPIDSIDYNGRKIEFTREYLQNMVTAFNDRAFDQVPLMMATDDNKHNNNPQNFRGEVVSLDMADDGLYATVTTTEDGMKLLQSNPRLGISARIVNDYDRSDGKHYVAAMQHALLTLDPRIPGLGSWDAVDSFSNSDNSGTIDLTGSEFDKPAKKTKKEKSVSKKDDNGLNEDELTRLRAFLDELDESGVDDSADDESELTDEELQDLIAALDTEDETDADEETVSEPELVSASLSNTDSTALELANEQAVELARIRDELDTSKWANERDALMRTTGLPPAVLDMAAPLLKGTKTLELSNGDKIDAGKIMREVLTEVGKLAKLLDLSNELGSPVGAEPDTSEEASAKRDETTRAIRAMMGN